VVVVNVGGESRDDVQLHAYPQYEASAPRRTHRTRRIFLRRRRLSRLRFFFRPVDVLLRSASLYK